MSPCKSIMAPPVFPRLIAASVWMIASYPSIPSPPRPVALTIPIVAVSPMPNGSPIAKITSPTCSFEESPIASVGSLDHPRPQALLALILRLFLLPLAESLIAEKLPKHRIVEKRHHLVRLRLHDLRRMNVDHRRQRRLQHGGKSVAEIPERHWRGAARPRRLPRRSSGECTDDCSSWLSPFSLRPPRFSKLRRHMSALDVL